MARQWADTWVREQAPGPRVVVTRGEGPHLAALSQRLHQAAIVSWVSNDYMLPRSVNIARLPSHLDFFANTVRGALSLGLELAVADPPQALIVPGSVGGVLEQELAILRSEARLESSTLRTVGRLWFDNIAQTLGELLASVAVSDLGPILAGAPVLVVAAGPSLDRLLPELATCREQLILLAVNSAVPRLYRAGIAPDAVVLLEGRDQSDHLAGVPGEFLANTVLIHAAQTHPAHLRWPCSMRVVFHDPSSLWLMPWHGAGSFVPSGGNAGTTALYLAWMLGGWPVLTTGLDLSYSEATGQDACGPGAGDLLKARGWRGEARWASAVMGDYRRQLELVLSEIHRKEPRARFSVLAPRGLAAPDGVRIEGMDVLPWAALARELPPLDGGRLRERIDRRLLEKAPRRDRVVLEESFARLGTQLSALLHDPLGPALGLALSCGQSSLRMLLGPALLELSETESRLDDERAAVRDGQALLARLERAAAEALDGPRGL